MEVVRAAVAMGRARALDDRVIALALDQAAAWLGRPRLPPTIAINVTADSLADPTFPGRLGVALVARGLEAGRIEIEIPEAIAIRDLDAVGPQLAALRAMGVRLALDDFGAGHSSLAHALRLPVQRLKLDRSIVSELPGGARSRAMLRAITALARSMEIELLAEGVETEAQAFALRREGVTLVQGYLYGVPQPASALIAAPALAAAG
jgi:EAL domain-containing protein (putative c-di-GMP-specific phosphodiesterase class I)